MKATRPPALIMFDSWCPWLLLLIHTSQKVLEGCPFGLQHLSMVAKTNHWHEYDHQSAVTKAFSEQSQCFFISYNQIQVINLFKLSQLFIFRSSLNLPLHCPTTSEGNEKSGYYFIGLLMPGISDG